MMLQIYDLFIWFPTADYDSYTYYQIKNYTLKTIKCLQKFKRHRTLNAINQ